MSNIPRFAAYAAAFEKAFENDDWAALEPYFKEDAVYEIGLPLLGAERAEGRPAILAWFKDVLDRFDRRFDSRRLELQDGPEDRDGAVWIRGAAIYSAEGVPEFTLVLEETVHFEGDEIVRLEDRYSDEAAAQAELFASEYGEQIGVDLKPGAAFGATASD